ncbi:MAG: PhoH family protein [Planctomycetota bacterium]
MEVTVRVPTGPEQIAVVGSAERNLKLIREAIGVHVASRDGAIRVSGPSGRVAVARRILDELAQAAKDGRPLSPQGVLDLIAAEAARAESAGMLADQPSPTTSVAGDGWEGPLTVAVSGRTVRPKTDGQANYLEAIRTNELVFGVGPAGTGKTYLAVAAAVHMLKLGRVQRVVLARPAVEAGERLGFLPGDLQDKVNPYLRPLLDALHDMLDFGSIRRFTESDVIEIVPLAFMRGRTLNHAVILLDEAQNTTRGQMQMALTRMGQGSRMIITGDTTQIDLPDPRQSGLVDAARRLARVPGVAFCQLLGDDVVRHRLVQRIVEAYGDDDKPAEHGEMIREALEGDA